MDTFLSEQQQFSDLRNKLCFLLKIRQNLADTIKQRSEDSVSTYGESMNLIPPYKDSGLTNLNREIDKTHEEFLAVYYKISNTQSKIKSVSHRSTDVPITSKDLTGNGSILSTWKDQVSHIVAAGHDTVTEVVDSRYSVDNNGAEILTFRISYSGYHIKVSLKNSNDNIQATSDPHVDGLTEFLLTLSKSDSLQKILSYIERFVDETKAL